VKQDKIYGKDNASAQSLKEGMSSHAFALLVQTADSAGQCLKPELDDTLFWLGMPVTLKPFN
jgi:hypothetical protein